MNYYAFQLGRQPKICLHELRSILPNDSFETKIGEFALFKLSSSIDFPKLQQRLGGTIKIVEITDTLSNDSTVEDFKTVLERILIDEFTDRSGKIPFGLTLENFKGQQFSYTKQLLSFSKKILKSLDLNSRFINKNFAPPGSAAIHKSKALTKGIDLNILKGNLETYLGKTITLQDIDFYSIRDYEKPIRDAKIGMTPPKLAQIMINFISPKLDNKKPWTIYDPFSGTGTYLIEANLMGFNAIGSDNNPDMVHASETNCKWFKNNYKSTAQFQIFEKDVQELTAHDLNTQPDCIVTESYLGPPQHSFPDRPTQDQIFEHLTQLHKVWLPKAHKILPPRGKIAICLPAFQNKSTLIYHPTFKKIAQNSGFRITEIFTYSRADQVVARNILVLEKTP
ncbi:hypothetical protein CVV38_04055 [Candidatus Peregrinibacteria bacterium HGW-Peregrinibacteria-1]|jgi:tRNA G10  N-methylase Trm11|nr:MAG: hypothetical protein CVV38_04055 [Candidatus Peregrinibacteria bacterium HGW-Peregrinibacteria-1]